VSRETTYVYIQGYIYWNFKTGDAYEGVVVEREDGIGCNCNNRTYETVVVIGTCWAVGL
jgi:hypothetical protein